MSAVFVWSLFIYYIIIIRDQRENQRWNKLEIKYAEIKEPSDLVCNPVTIVSVTFVLLKIHNYNEQKVLCQNMGFLILYGEIYGHTLSM